MVGLDLFLHNDVDPFDQVVKSFVDSLFDRLILRYSMSIVKYETKTDRPFDIYEKQKKNERMKQ
jgi:hypothetical protein